MKKTLTTEQPILGVGDRVIAPLPIYRKWWQFWKPRIVGHERRELVIVATSSGDKSVMPIVT